jgi:prophage regulatory protein
MTLQIDSALTIVRRKQVEAATGYRRSTLYLRIAQGLWTRPVHIGARAVGWPLAEVAALNSARISGKSDKEIRDLVDLLTAARKSAVWPDTRAASEQPAPSVRAPIQVKPTVEGKERSRGR